MVFSTAKVPRHGAVRAVRGIKGIHITKMDTGGNINTSLKCNMKRTVKYDVILYFMDSKRGELLVFPCQTLFLGLIHEFLAFHYRASINYIRTNGEKRAKPKAQCTI